MGTNYYLYTDPCPHCGRGDNERHIGKSSGGWCFALHVYPEDGIYDLSDWQREWGKGIIKNEYGDIVSPTDMYFEIVGRRGKRDWPTEYSAEEAQFHTRNYSERGPNGLLRSKIDGRHCIGHGDGTWDLIAGDFS